MLVAFNSSNEVEEKVNKLIEAGWLPQGGVSISTYDPNAPSNTYPGTAWRYAQAMVRRI